MGNCRSVGRRLFVREGKAENTEAANCSPLPLSGGAEGGGGGGVEFLNFFDRQREPRPGPKVPIHSSYALSTRNYIYLLRLPLSQVLFSFPRGPLLLEVRDSSFPHTHIGLLTFSNNLLWYIRYCIFFCTVSLVKMSPFKRLQNRDIIYSGFVPKLT